MKKNKVTTSPDFDFNVDDVKIENDIVAEIEITEIKSEDIEIEVSEFDIESVASK